MADPNDKLLYLMPSEISGLPGIETQSISLKIDAKTERWGRACRANLVFSDGHTESCIAVRKETAALASETFQFLSSCSHTSIAKPIGFWHDEAKGAGYVIFHHFDGLLSELPMGNIFEVDEANAISGFSKTGFRILRDVVSAVKYVNDHYQRGPPDTVKCIPVKPLSIGTATVFYQMKAYGDILLLLTDFDSDIDGEDENGENEKGENDNGQNEKGENENGQNEKGENENGQNEIGEDENGENEKGKNEKCKNVKGRTKERNVAPFKKFDPKEKRRRKTKKKANAGNPGEEPAVPKLDLPEVDVPKLDLPSVDLPKVDVGKICSRNWNNLGKYIVQLYGECTVKFEVDHLAGRLKEQGIKYGDLVWEAGLWDLSTKIQFIREIFWFYDKQTTRKSILVGKDALGFQRLIDRLEVKQLKNKGEATETRVIIKEKNLLKSLLFLRVFILAHQSEVLEGVSGLKIHAPDLKSAEKIVSQEKPDYMVKLIQEIRPLGWFKSSPFLRSGHDSMVEFQEDLARVKKSEYEALMEAQYKANQTEVKGGTEKRNTF